MISEEMELQLGLALPSNQINGFDLNSLVCEPKEGEGSNHFGCGVLQLGSSLFSGNGKKRGFEEAVEQRRTVPPTLPLLLWDEQPNEKDDPRNLRSHSSLAVNKNDGESLVGWPPIKTHRKKVCHQNQRNRTWNNGAMENNGGGFRGRASNSMYVKVKMEGVGIARKIDLSLFHSLETLKETLISMFSTYHEDSTSYRLTYQDREGDWLLALDVPWRTFIRSVQRLKLQRMSA